MYACLLKQDKITLQKLTENRGIFDNFYRKLSTIYQLLTILKTTFIINNTNVLIYKTKLRIIKQKETNKKTKVQIKKLRRVDMKEIRLHGRGGQGVVKASQIVVKAAVAGNLYGQFIPFFGVERKGSPVFGYLRLSETEIRRKTQVYEPDVLVIMDDSLVELPETYAGLKDGALIVINSTKTNEELAVPANAGAVAKVDASGISERIIGRNIPNTAVLGAFVKAFGTVDKETLFQEIEKAFGAKNREAAEAAYDSVEIIQL